jgi:hypothetical protein
MVGHDNAFNLPRTDPCQPREPASSLAVPYSLYVQTHRSIGFSPWLHVVHVLVHGVELGVEQVGVAEAGVKVYHDAGVGSITSDCTGRC